MLQSFEFANNAVSLLLSVFSVIVGMTYPLLLQAIQRIDEQYGSSRISKMLKGERDFRVFQWLVAIAIGLAFVSIFILQLFDGHTILTILWISVHSLLTLSLLISTISLVYTILMYYSPDELLECIDRLKNSKKGQSCLLETFDIAKYAANIEDEKVYRIATQMLSSSLYEHIQKELKKEETANNGVCFTADQIDLMKQILNMVCKSDNNFFVHESMLVNVWFYPIHYVPISEETWQFIWFSVTNVLNADHDKWFMNYWTFAEQYYRFYLKDIKDTTNDAVKQRLTFKLFHIALGAHLWHKGKYDLLRQVLRFTQTLPPSYLLIDNTFVEILEDMARIYDLKDRHPWALTKRYMMSDKVNDVYSDDYIASMFNSYFSLLMVRLNKVGNNGSYVDALFEPKIKEESSIRELNEQIRYVDILLNFLNDTNFIEKLKEIGYDPAVCRNSKDLLEQYKSKIEAAIQGKVDNPEPDPQKINYIKQELVEEVKRQRLYLPSKNQSKLDDNNISRDSFWVYQSLKVSTADYAKYMARLSANMEEAIVASLLLQEQQHYNRFFLLNRPSATYTVRFKDLTKAFKRLKVNERHTILSLGVYLGTFSDLYGQHPSFSYSDGTGSFNGADILSIPSNVRAFVVMLESELPYIEHVEVLSKESEDLKCIDANAMLYSNVEALSETNNELKVARKVDLVYKKGATNYIMLKVEYNTDSSLYDLEKIDALWQTNDMKNDVLL